MSVELSILMNVTLFGIVIMLGLAIIIDLLKDIKSDLNRSEKD